MISRETERFVNGIDTHDAEVRSSHELLENLQESKEGVPHKERKVTTSHKETWADSITEETRAASLIPRMRKSGLLFLLILDVEVIWQCKFPETVGSRCWESIESVLVRKCAREGARDFSDQTWLQHILKAAQRKELSTVKIRMEFYVIYELFKGIPVVFQVSLN